MEKTIKIAVACHNAGGEADFHFFKLKTLDSYIQDGCYEDRAKEISHDEGYDGPYVIFDETCFAGRAIMDHFVWDSATTYEQFP